MGELALWMSEIMGLTSLFGLLLDLRRHRYALTLSIATLVMGIICFGSLIRTGNSGGEIRRPEIRTGTNSSAGVEADND
jgi:hypothetical protein